MTASATSTEEGAASTASDGAVYTGFGGSDATETAAAAEEDSSSAGTNAAAVLLNIGQLYGLGVVAAGIFAGFSILL